MAGSYSPKKIFESRPTKPNTDLRPVVFAIEGFRMLSVMSPHGPRHIKE